jgi:ATP-binding cassette subfamily B protein
MTSFTVNKQELSLPTIKILPQTPWRFIWFFVRNQFAINYLAIILVMIAGRAFDTLEPYFVKKLINALSSDATNISREYDALYWFFMLIGTWLLGSFFFRVQNIIDLRTAPYLRESVQNHMFGYLLGHSPRYFQDNFAGKLGQKVKEAAKACMNILEMICVNIVSLLVLFTVSMFLLIQENQEFALVLAIWVIVYIIISVLLAKRCVGLSAAFSAQGSIVSGKMVDSIGNADSIRSYARSQYERALLGTALIEERRRSIKLRWFLIMMRIFQAIAIITMISILSYMAISQVLAGKMNIGSFSMVFGLTSFISMNVWTLSNELLDFFESIGSLTEALDLVTKQHEITDTVDAQRLNISEGKIEFRNLVYQHPDGLQQFNNFNLVINPGEKVALVGPSGAGKSTLIKLLRRHFEPTSGDVIIDGQNIQHVTWDSLNEAIAEVSQNPSVFHRPIIENIRYGKLTATDNDVETAAKQAYCHEFIVSRPLGYQTIVGERGIKLSGGERQRIAIARALLKNAPIVILDEATSALDSESEHLIQRAFQQLMQGRTVIAIAHRLSTIVGMDRIIYLESGRIIEYGSHQQLLNKNGKYAALWKRQVGGFITT